MNRYTLLMLPDKLSSYITHEDWYAIKQKIQPTNLSIYIPQTFWSLFSPFSFFLNVSSDKEKNTPEPNCKYYVIRRYEYEYVCRYGYGPYTTIVLCICRSYSDDLSIRICSLAFCFFFTSLFLQWFLLYQRIVARKEINTVAKTKNTKARKNVNNCIGNKWVKSSNSWVCKNVLIWN